MMPPSIATNGNTGMPVLLNIELDIKTIWQQVDFEPQPMGASLSFVSEAVQSYAGIRRFSNHSFCLVRNGRTNCGR